MKTVSSLLLLILCITTLQSCKKETSKIEAPKVYRQLEKAKWFIGNWDNVENDAHFIETWKQKNDSTLEGKSTVTINGEIVFHEAVEVLQRNDSLFYIVSVEGQNKEKPVSFYMTKASKNVLVFENPTHDYPTKITYARITNDRLIATISGMKDGKESNEEYQFKRK